MILLLAHEILVKCHLANNFGDPCWSA